ncbi:MAG: DUF5684 domain-containing protein [Ruminococcus sp.]|nr:DUF5684 domain-containing protein [Ruminococcus sp.]
MILESIIDEIGKSPQLFEAALILTLLTYDALIVAQWKLFNKAGEKGWKSLIPFYNLFVSHHIIGMRHIWFVLDIIFWAVEIVLDLVKATPVWVEEVFFSLAIIVTIVSEILHIMKLCYCYTKSELFGIGLFVIPPVFSLILAFDKSEYNPPRAHKERHKHHKSSGA